MGKNLVALALPIFAAVILCGCAVYQPPNLPEDQLALLSVEEWRVAHVRIIEIDGKEPSSLQAYTGLGNADDVPMAPGKHTVRVEHSTGGLHGFAELWFVASSGGKYLIRARSAGAKFRAWIEDRATGNSVGGHVGSSDEPKS